ncbi:MAG: Sensor kinase CusS [Bacteroidota bacterium]|jgi:signal transduction histidine kinase
MTIKSKISFYLSITFTVLFGVICISVYFLFANFRKQEFQERLEEKSKSTIKLLRVLNRVNVPLLNAIDKHKEDQLHKDNTLIFNEHFQLIYSTHPKSKILWNEVLLNQIKTAKKYYWRIRDIEYMGIYMKGNRRSFISIIAAKDTLGLQQLDFLWYSLIGAYLLFTIATWIISFKIVKNQLKPIDDFHHEISRINEQNLNESFVVPIQSNNEIHLLSNEFNHMIQRISKAYQKQKEFTAQASHELRTPLARMSSQLENQLNQVSTDQIQFIKKQLDEVTQLNELISSLLILSKTEGSNKYSDEFCRLDEVVYSSIEKVTLLFPKFKVHLEFEDSLELEAGLSIQMNAQLLEIVIGNLLKNAWIYGDEQSPIVCIGMKKTTCFIRIQNKGTLLKNKEIDLLYEPFMRGSNAKKKEGLGLGLRIVYRILQTYGFHISYSKNQKLNTFTITF